MKRVDKYLKIFKEHFNNPEIVKKKTLELEGYTRLGQELIEKVKRGL